MSEIESFHDQIGVEKKERMDDMSQIKQLDINEITRDGKINEGEKHAGMTLVTDRDFNEYRHLLHLKNIELANKTILDLGSGRWQQFGRMVEHKFPWTKVFCVDASLKKEDRREEVRESRFSKKYRGLEDVDLSSTASLFSALPYKDSSFDIVMSLYGTPAYGNTESRQKSISEIIRVLKQGGEARLYPVFQYHLNDGYLDNIKTIPGISVELFDDWGLFSVNNSNRLYNRLHSSIDNNKSKLLIIRKHNES